MLLRATCFFPRRDAGSGGSRWRRIHRNTARAVQLVQQQHWAEALDQIQNLRKQYPGNPKVENLQGLALLGSGDPNGRSMHFNVLSPRVRISSPR